MPLNTVKVKSAGFTPVIVGGADLLALLGPEGTVGNGRAGCQAVVLGVEGVLVDVREIETKSWRKLACELGAVVDPTEEFLRRSPAECLHALLGPVGREMDAMEKRMLLDRRREHFSQMLAEAGPSDIARGAKELIARLRMKGVAVGCWATCAGGRRALETLGAMAWFEAIVDEGIGMSFWGGGALRGAAAKMRARVGQCAVIDRSEVALAAAKSAGMRTVSVGVDPALAYLAECHVRTVAELTPEMLDRLAERAVG